MDGENIELQDIGRDDDLDTSETIAETPFDGRPTEGVNRNVNLIEQRRELNNSFLESFEQLHGKVKSGVERSLLLADLKRRDDGCWYWKDLRLTSKGPSGRPLAKITGKGAAEFWRMFDVVKTPIKTRQDISNVIATDRNLEEIEMDIIHEEQKESDARTALLDAEKRGDDKQANFMRDKLATIRSKLFNRRGYERIKGEEVSFAEKSKLLIKKHGILIGTALSVMLLFANLVTSIVNVLKPGPMTPKPGPDPSPGPKPGPSPSPKPEPGPGSSILDKLKEVFRKLADWLKQLALKALGILPGIIGAIVSWLLKTGSGIVGVLAEHLGMFLIGGLALICGFLLRPINKGR